MPNHKRFKIFDLSQLTAEQVVGVTSVLLSTFFLGWAPIMGKLAYNAGVTPYTLAAIRTLLAAGLLWLAYLVLPTWRRYIRITRHNLIGCMIIGGANGIGSLFYYTGLSRLDASLVSLLNTLYPLWVVVFLAASGQPLKRFTMLRLLLAGMGVILLTQIGGAGQAPEWLGVMLMIASAAAYGWHLVMGQWVLVDVPSGSVTLYVLTSMAVVVCVARGVQATPLEPINLDGWLAIGGLGLFTALSRLTMFLGLRRLGGVQTALIGLLELFITLLLAFFILGERLTLIQWLGGLLLALAVGLIGQDIQTSTSPEEWIAALEDEADKSAQAWQDWKEKQQTLDSAAR